MHLSTRQVRIYRLALLLGGGKPVLATEIVSELACSEPTLSRALKELRESWHAEIKYSKASHSYQMTATGLLDKKTLRRMNEDLTENAATKPVETVSRVFLDKDKKKAVSLSLRMSLLRKIDQLSYRLEITRSEAMEMVIAQGIDDVLRQVKSGKKE